MFNFFKSRDADVLTHWYAPVEDFAYSPDAFYAEIERELAARKVPSLELSQVEFAEGGLLSHKRVYLRMLRERLVFDVCAAPFGTAYFFSLRFAELLPTVKLWELLVFLVGLGVLLAILVKVAGYLSGFFLFVVLVVAGIWILRNAVSLGLGGTEAELLTIPVIGPIYDRFLRRETYYRQDSRLMYLAIVDAVVKQKVEEVTAAKGVKLLQFREHSPILNELYKPTSVRREHPRRPERDRGAYARTAGPSRPFDRSKWHRQKYPAFQHDPGGH